jgi:hypothetical protein
MTETDEPLDEVQELTWALVDEQATDTEVHRLEELLRDSDEARHTYVMCMQMHADLHFLLGGKRLPLPDVVQEAMRKAEAKPRKLAALPLVNMPSPGAGSQVTNGHS